MSIKFLTGKFPIQKVVKWQEFLMQEVAEQWKLFSATAFMKWLAEAGVSWKLLAVSETGFQGMSSLLEKAVLLLVGRV